MARVVRFHELGGPEVLKIDTLDLPPPGPGEISIDVRALGLNRAEALFRAGQYLEQSTLPSRIGYEAAGIVRAVGPGVSGFAPGDAVATIPGFFMSKYGVYADAAVVPAGITVKTPEFLSFTQAAAVWMQYMTAYGALIDIAGLTAADTVVIPAASSSVGIAAIQIARAVGATTIATTRTGAKRPALHALGAHHVIATDEQDVTGEILALTGNKGARVVFDPVAGPMVEKLAAATADQGIIVLYGLLSGAPTPFPLLAALGKGLTLRGYTLFEIVSNPARLASGKSYVLDGLSSGALNPVIARTFPFEEIVAAHRYLESNQQIGKIVVEVS